MDIVTAAGRNILGKASDGTAMILRIVSFFSTYAAIQIIVNNIITNADGFAARGINAVSYALYDASWLVGQEVGIVSLRGEFAIIAFMNSAFQFLLSALIAYELAEKGNEWCKPMRESVVDPDSMQGLSLLQRLAYYILPFKTAAHGKVKYMNGTYTFGPINTIVYYLIPQGLSLRSRHVRANANRSALMYLGLWLLLAAVDIWATTMFRIKMLNGFDYSLVWVALATSVIYNIVLAELALLISGGIAIATLIDGASWLWGKASSRAASSKKKPAVTISNAETKETKVNASRPANPNRPSNPPIRSGQSGATGYGGRPSGVDDLFRSQGIVPVYEED